jgi:simple sugar transport system permease protein
MANRKVVKPASDPSSPAVASRTQGRAFSVSDFLLKYGMILAILVLVVIFSLRTKAFFSLDNFLDILRAISILSIVALGVTLSVVVTGLTCRLVCAPAVILAPALIIWRASDSRRRSA